MVPCSLQAFINTEHSGAFPNTTLTSQSRSTSDHTPLLVTMTTSIPRNNLFRFENAWLRNPAFLPSVLPAWNEAPACADAAGLLVGCLKSTRAAAKVWARRTRAPPAIIPNCKFLILLFDSLEENRPLSLDEQHVRIISQERLSQEVRARAAYW